MHLYCEDENVNSSLPLDTESSRGSTLSEHEWPKMVIDLLFGFVTHG